MASAGEITMENICPAAGMIIATLMFFAPYHDLKTAIARGHLGTLNPTPWVFMFGNCFGWVTYSFLIRNFWLFFSNCPGLVLSVWLNLGAVKLLYQGHFSAEMRKNFSAYLEQEAKKQQEENKLKQSNSHRRSLSQSLADIFSGGDLSNEPQGDALAATNEGEPKGHSRSPSETVADAVAEIFSGPVVGPGHKRTLSTDVAAEVFVVAPTIEKLERSDSTMMIPDSGPTHPGHRRAPSESVAGAVADAVETVTDFAKIVWDVTSQTTPAPAPHERMVMWIVLLWTVVVCIIAFAERIDVSTKALIVGIVTNFNLVFFYGAPLSTVLTVLKERNSESIHVPTMITNTMSSTFWMVYGLAISDWFVAAPNGLGTLLGGTQFVLYFMLPRTRPDAVKPEEKQDAKATLEENKDTTHVPENVRLKRSRQFRSVINRHRRWRKVESPITSIQQLNQDIENPILPPALGETQPEPVIPEHETLQEEHHA